WHPPQPFCAISACPSATAVGSGGGPEAGLPADAGDEELEGPHAVATSASTPNTVTRRTRLQCEIVEVIFLQPSERGDTDREWSAGAYARRRRPAVNNSAAPTTITAPTNAGINSTPNNPNPRSRMPSAGNRIRPMKPPIKPASTAPIPPPGNSPGTTRPATQPASPA